MRDGAAHGDPQPDHAQIPDRDLEACWLSQEGEIGGDTMSDEMTRTDAVAGVFNTLKFLDRGLLNLADHATKRNVTWELDAGLGDALDGNQRRGEAAFHIVGAEPPDPAVTINRLGLKPFAHEMLLVPGV
jgi:hypothetical protein